MPNLTPHSDLFAFSCSISFVGDEWECKFRGIDMVGYAPTAMDAACRRFTRVVDNRKPKPERTGKGYAYANPDTALARAKSIAMRPKYEKLAALLEAHKAKKKARVA